MKCPICELKMHKCAGDANWICKGCNKHFNIRELEEGIKHG